MHTPLVLNVAVKEKVFGSEIRIFAVNSFYNCHLNKSGPGSSNFTFPRKYLSSSVGLLLLMRDCLDLIPSKCKSNR